MTTTSMTTTVATDPDEKISAAVETPVSAPPLSDSTPLAFAAVGLPFAVVSLTFTGVLSADVSVVALPLALVYGTIGLVIAGIVSFRNHDAFGRSPTPHSRASSCPMRLSRSCSRRRSRRSKRTVRDRPSGRSSPVGRSS